jgi:hypothetical protein
MVLVPMTQLASELEEVVASDVDSLDPDFAQEKIQQVKARQTNLSRLLLTFDVSYVQVIDPIETRIL